MIQLAWLWLRYQPGSELAEWFRNRVGTLAGRTRRIAIVAMARKLLIALWRYVETGVVPAGAEIRDHELAHPVLIKDVPAAFRVSSHRSTALSCRVNKRRPLPL